MTNNTTKPAAGKKLKSLHEAALQVLREANLGPNVAHADAPQKLNPTDGPARGAVQDLQNRNNAGPVGGRSAGGPDGAPQKLEPSILPGGGIATQDLGNALTDATGPGMDVPPSMKGNDRTSRTTKVPGGNYPAQEKFNPTSKKIFAEDDIIEDDMVEASEDDEDDDKGDKPDFKKMGKDVDDSDDDDDKEDHDEPDGDECKKEEYEPLLPEEAIEFSIGEANLDEHLNAILSTNGTELTEEFKSKTATIFEAAIREVAFNIYAVLDEQYQGALNEATALFEQQMSEQVDTYLGYVVEQWVAENEVAIESGLRSELTEDFMNGMRKLFAENYIDVPESKVDVIESLSSKVDELEAQLNEEFENSVRLRKELAEANKAEIFHHVTRGLTDVQVDKLAGLAESVNFTEANEYAEKLQTLKESYLTPGVKAPASSGSKTLDSIEPTTNENGKTLTEDKEVVLNPRMAAYSQALGRQVKSATFRNGTK